MTTLSTNNAAIVNNKMILKMDVFEGSTLTRVLAKWVAANPGHQDFADIKAILKALNLRN